MPRLVNFLNTNLEQRLLYYRQHGRKRGEHYAEVEVVGTLAQLAVDTRLEGQELWKLISILVAYLTSGGVCSELVEAAFDQLVVIAVHSDSMSVLHFIDSLHKTRQSLPGKIDQLRDIVCQL